MKFDAISIAFIVIIAVFAIIGIKKGFFKTLVSLIKSILSFVAAIFLTVPLTKIIIKTPVGPAISTKICTNLEGKDEVFKTIVTESNKDAIVQTGLQKLNISENLSKLLKTFVSKQIEANGESTLGASFGDALTYYIVIAISFILIFIAIYILTFILNKIFDGLTSLSIGKFIDKLLGFAVYTIVGAIIVCIIAYGMSALVSSGGELGNWIYTTLALDTDEMSVGKYIYLNNPVDQVLTYITGLITK